MNKSRSENYNKQQDVVLELPNQITTEFDEFNWNRERKLKPRHIVYKFIEQMQKLIKDEKFQVKMFMPKKKLFLALEQI